MEQLATPQQGWELEFWGKVAEPCVYKKGNTLVYQNHFLSGAYVLFSGSIRFLRSGNRGVEISPRVHEGCVIGLHWLLDNQAAPCTVKVMKESKIAFLPKPLVLNWFSIFRKIHDSLPKT